MEHTVDFPAPSYLYKILPSSAYPLPSPLPQILRLPALDYDSGFVHLCTSYQIINALNTNFSSEPFVIVLQISYETISEHVKWENSEGRNAQEIAGEWGNTKRANEFFPHMYPNHPTIGIRIGYFEINQIGVWTRNSAVWDVHGWPFDTESLLPNGTS